MLDLYEDRVVEHVEEGGGVHGAGHRVLFQQHYLLQLSLLVCERISQIVKFVEDLTDS